MHSGLLRLIPQAQIQGTLWSATGETMRVDGGRWVVDYCHGLDGKQVYSFPYNKSHTSSSQIYTDIYHSKLYPLVPFNINYFKTIVFFFFLNGSGEKMKSKVKELDISHSSNLFKQTLHGPYRSMLSNFRFWNSRQIQASIPSPKIE